MDQNIVNTEAKEFLKNVFCIFDSPDSQIGLAIFGKSIQEVIPLASRTVTQWHNAIDAAYAVPQLFEKGGRTPTLEGLELAHKMMVTNGIKSHDQMIFVVTDGIPNPLAGVSTNDPVISSSLPYNTFVYDTDFGPFYCDAGSGNKVPNCIQTTIGDYYFVRLFNESTLIQQDGHRMERETGIEPA